MKYREFMVVKPGVRLLVGVDEKSGKTFPVHNVSDYTTFTKDRWRNLISKTETGEHVLELPGGGVEVRLWLQVLGMPDVKVGAKKMNYRERHFKRTENGTEARVKTQTIEGDVPEEDSVTYVYADVKDEGTLLCVEKKGGKIFVWYSTLVFDLKSIKVQQ